MDSTRFPFEKLEQEKKRLISLRKYEPLVSDTDADLDQLVKAAAFICESPISLVNLIEANKTIFKAAVGTELKGSPREISFCAQAIQGNSLLEINDTWEDERFKNNPLVTGSEKIRFYAGTPLMNKEGMSMGTLCVFDQKPKILSPQQKESLETLGRMAMMVMENKKQQLAQQKTNLPAILALEEQLREQSERLQLLRHFLPAKTAAKYYGSGSNQSDGEIRNMVLLQCKINQFDTLSALLGPAKTLEILQVYYTELFETLSTYNGLVYKFDGETITAFFAEPLATFPYDENALYCAFDIRRQFESGETFKKLALPHPLTIVITLHTGDVLTGTASHQSGIEYVIAGDVLKQITIISEKSSHPSNIVLLTSAMLNRTNNLVRVIRQTSLTDSAVFPILAISEVVEKT